MSYDRYAECDDTCTVDCGQCKGQGPPAPGERRPGRTAIWTIERDEQGVMTYAEGWTTRGTFAIEVEGDVDGITQLADLGFTRDQIMEAARSAVTVRMDGPANYDRFAEALRALEPQEEA